jgi:5'/3'-nucleotidase SurE
MARLLVSNDDGVKSLLWQRLCDALAAAGHEVWGVAPEEDKSWTAAAQTLHKELTLRELSAQRYSVDGLPADAAAVGIAYLKAQGKMPDAVVSGINVGVNTRLPCIVASGTVGAAITGAMMGLPALALSYAMPREYSAEAKRQGGILPQTEAATAAMLIQSVARVARILTEEKVYGRVWNVNFPAAVAPDTLWARAPMAHTLVESYVALGENGRYKPVLKMTTPLNSATYNEFHAIGEGKIAESVLDFARLG